MPAHAIAPTPTSESRTPPAICRGARNTARTDRAISLGTVARSSSASESSCVRDGIGAGSQRCSGSLGFAALGSEVEQHRDDVDARDAVHERVVRLADEREAAALDALDQPDLPQRLVAVELLGEHAARERAQLLLGAGRGQRGLAHVVAQVQVRVVDPARPALAERHEGELLAVARDEVEPALDPRDELVVGGRVAVEEHHRGDVHVGGVVLEVQERRVERGQPVRHQAPTISASRWRVARDRGYGCAVALVSRVGRPLRPGLLALASPAAGGPARHLDEGARRSTGTPREVGVARSSERPAERALDAGLDNAVLNTQVSANART